VLGKGIPSMKPSGKSSLSDWTWARYQLLEELGALHQRWANRIGPLERRRRGKWARGVLFGIEIAQNKLAEYAIKSRKKLAAVLTKWERDSRRKVVGGNTPATRGIDYGIRIVADRARRTMQDSRPVKRLRDRRKADVRRSRAKIRTAG
jgi:hypothetical protein